MPLSFTTHDLLDWSVDEVIGRGELEKRLASGRPLRVKLGIDPTSPDVHLGRSIPLWRLRAFQELGHEIHLIIGDFTGQIGDTSDKDAERPMLSEERVKENLSHYLDQLWMILNKERESQVHIHYNSEWLGNLSLGHISQLADSFSVNQFIKRELVAKRLESGSRVSLREMLYPLMQGYDSLMVEADVELGGTDQRFNMLAGRTLQEAKGLPAQAIIMNTLIVGTDGRKMSSSWGNVISLRDTPTDKFGKVMSIPDGLIGEYLNFLPRSAQPFSLEELGARLGAGENPRDLKLALAERLVALYHGEEAGAAERERFIAQFSKGEQPEEMQEYGLAGKGARDIVSVLVDAGLAPSRGEARRLIEQGGVRIDGQTVSDPATEVAPGQVIEKGKRGFLKIVE